MTEQIENKPSKITIVDQQVMSLYEYEFDFDIESVDQFAELLELLANASEHDLVRIHNTSRGGDLDVALRVASAITNARCVTSCVVHGMVSSAATIIALSCEIVSAMPFSTFHVHSLSTGIGGKVSDIGSYSTYMVAANKRLIESIYDGFLTKEEIAYVLNGGELYLTDEETNTKLVALGKAAGFTDAEREEAEQLTNELIKKAGVH